jgi:hypothetical protein
MLSVGGFRFRLLVICPGVRHRVLKRRGLSDCRSVDDTCHREGKEVRLEKAMRFEPNTFLEAKIASEREFPSTFASRSRSATQSVASYIGHHVSALLASCHVPARYDHRTLGEITFAGKNRTGNVN